MYFFPAKIGPNTSAKLELIIT